MIRGTIDFAPNFAEFDAGDDVFANDDYKGCMSSRSVMAKIYLHMSNLHPNVFSLHLNLYEK